MPHAKNNNKNNNSHMYAVYFRMIYAAYSMWFECYRVNLLMRQTMRAYTHRLSTLLFELLSLDEQKIKAAYYRAVSVLLRCVVCACAESVIV